MATLPAELVQRLTDAVVRGVLERRPRPELGGERAEAVRQCLHHGTVAMLTTLSRSEVVTEDWLTAFLETRAVHRELDRLLGGDGLDVPELVSLFAEAGGDGAAQVQELEPALQAFQDLFRLTAARSEALAELPLARNQQPGSAWARELLDSLRDARPGTIGIGAGSISGENVVSGTQVIITTPPPSEDRERVTRLRANYLGWVMNTCKSLSLGGIDPQAMLEQRSLQLEAVYTALNTSQEQREDRLDDHSAHDVNTALVPAITQLHQHDRLVLLGDPGSGKTTFVNFVALCFAGEALGDPQINLRLLTEPLPSPSGGPSPPRQQWDHAAVLPVVVVLRDFAARGLPEPGIEASADDLREFIAAELKSAALDAFAPMLEDELRDQGGVVLFDGLDEVTEADRRREQVKQAVDSFQRSYNRCRILVTSRIYAYQKEQWRLPGFAEATLAPFNEDQIQIFVDRWYRHLAAARGLRPDEATRQAEALLAEIFSHDRLLALAERPLLLTLMASLHHWRGTLPDGREQLYREAVDLLLDRWEQRHEPGAGDQDRSPQSLYHRLGVKRSDLRRLLEQLAFEAHKRQPTLTGTADLGREHVVNGLIALNEDLRPVQVINYLSQRLGILIPRGEHVYAFPHRTFQEYLAACHLTDDPEYPDSLAELVRADVHRWREVAVLAGAKAAFGSANTIWPLVEALCHTDPPGDGTDAPPEAWSALIAGEALTEAAPKLDNLPPRNAGKLERLKRWHLYLLSAPGFPPVERARAGNTLGRLGDPREEATTLDGMQFCYVPAGRFHLGENLSDQRDLRLDPDETLEWHLCNVPYNLWMARYPLTVAQYRAFVTDGGYGDARYWREAAEAGFWRDGAVLDGPDGPPRRGPVNLGAVTSLPDHPVAGVSWYEALAFCRWLTDWLRERRYLDADLIACLPSEAEWEKAARGGLKLPPEPIIARVGEDTISPSPISRLDGLENPRLRRRYPWGGALEPHRANYDETGIGNTTAIGCFPEGSSPYGVQELSGNLWEWTRSLWGEEERTPEFAAPYDSTDGREELGAPAKVLRVVRGGTVGLGDPDIRCSYRASLLPTESGGADGFRVVLIPASRRRVGLDRRKNGGARAERRP